jgi:hypothetical protein
MGLKYYNTRSEIYVTKRQWSDTDYCNWLALGRGRSRDAAGKKRGVLIDGRCKRKKQPRIDCRMLTPSGHPKMEKRREGNVAGCHDLARRSRICTRPNAYRPFHLACSGLGCFRYRCQSARLRHLQRQLELGKTPARARPSQYKRNVADRGRPWRTLLNFRIARTSSWKLSSTLILALADVSICVDPNDRASCWPSMSARKRDQHTLGCPGRKRKRLTFPVYLSFIVQIDLVGDHDDREIILVLDLSGVNFVNTSVQP